MTDIEIHYEPIWNSKQQTYWGPVNRTLNISGTIDSNIAAATISQILALDQINSNPIIIYINTQGGSLADGYAIYDAIKNSSSHITTIATGMCASAGLTILLAGDKKLCTENALFFYHQPVINSKKLNSLECSQGFHEGYKMCQHLYDAKIRENTGISMSEWIDNFKNKTIKYFNSTEALKYGFVDSIKKTSKKNFTRRSNGK